MNLQNYLNKRRKVPRKSRRGFTLTETLFVMIIVIAFLVGIIALFNVVNNKRLNTQLQSQLIRATRIIESTYSYSADFDSGSLLIHLAGEGFTDKELRKNASDVYEMYSPYETVITVVGNGARDYTVVVNDLPKAACKIAALTFIDSGAGLDSLDIGGTTITLPMSEASVASACDNATNDVTLVF